MGGQPRFYVGDGANQFMRFAAGSGLTLRGNLTADDIQAGGTITGNTLRTAASGKRFEVSRSDNEAHFYGDRGDGVVEDLANIGIRPIGSDTIIAYFGGPSSTRVAVRAEAAGSGAVIDARSHPNASLVGAAVSASSDIGTGVLANTETGHAVSGQATNGGYAGYFNAISSTAGAPLRLVPRSSAGAPTHSALQGALAVDSNGILYINANGGSFWQKVGAQ